jgi:hypothetical protein
MSSSTVSVHCVSRIVDKDQIFFHLLSPLIGSSTLCTNTFHNNVKFLKEHYEQLTCCNGTHAGGPATRLGPHQGILRCRFRALSEAITRPMTLRLCVSDCPRQAVRPTGGESLTQSAVLALLMVTWPQVDRLWLSGTRAPGRTRMEQRTGSALPPIREVARSPTSQLQSLGHARGRQTSSAPLSPPHDPLRPSFPV